MEFVTAAPNDVPKATAPARMKYFVSIAAIIQQKTCHAGSTLNGAKRTAARHARRMKDEQVAANCIARTDSEKAAFTGNGH